MTNHFEDGGIPSEPEKRPPTHLELQAVVDTIDILIAANGTPPYDVNSLNGAYPMDVPVIPLEPVDDLIDFGIKRYPRESMMYHPEIAQVQRRRPLSENGMDAKRFEILHIVESPDGLKAEKQFRDYFDEDESVSAQNFLWAQEMNNDLELNKIVADDIKEVKIQLSRTHIVS